MESQSDTITLTRDEYDRLSKYAALDEITSMVEYYYYMEPDMDAMLEGAKRGLLAGLDDPYTYYYNPEEYASLWENDSGEYGGVGIQISASYVTMLCTITRVFSDSPADKAGLRKGDVLVKVDDLDVSATTLYDAVRIMRGELGTPVAITVLRGTEFLDFSVPRELVHVNWVSSTLLDGNVGYIQLYDFSGDCYQRFAEQLDALIKQHAKALIIDLRDNPGGWVDDAVNIADLFISSETVTYLEYRNGQRDYYDATPGALSIPLVVLINENSASASEILAGAFQDYGMATIVGTQSYGKGIVQFVLPLSGEDEGAGMQISAAKYYTPSGRSVHKAGITPDIIAELPEDDQTLYELGDLADTQLNAAYEVALSLIDRSFVTALPGTTEEPSQDAETEADSAATGVDPEYMIVVS